MLITVVDVIPFVYVSEVLLIQDGIEDEDYIFGYLPFDYFFDVILVLGFYVQKGSFHVLGHEFRLRDALFIVIDVIVDFLGLFFLRLLTDTDSNTISE